MKPKITSKVNDKVKYIKSLNEKKNRQNLGAFYVEGIKVLEEIINSKKAIDILFIAYSKDILFKTKNGEETFNNVSLYCKKNNIELIEFETNIFNYVTDTITSQGILAVIKIQELDIDLLLQENKNKNILILDKIQDLGNVGTILRTADAFNIDLVFCINGTADIYSPKAIRSTMGSIFRVNVVYVDSSDLDLILYKIKENGQAIVTTDLSANNYLNEICLDKKYAFVFGNESNGVSEKIKKISDLKIKINMGGNVESLNVAIAAGIVLNKQFIDKVK